MSTVFLSTTHDPYELQVRRVTLGDRWAARVHAHALDASIAAGTNPDATVPLSLHAQTLHRPHCRRRIARGYRRLLASANAAPHPFDSSVPLARAEIRECADRVREVADMLESDEPLNPHGIAQARLLLTEGTSPLYRPSAHGDVGPALDVVIDSLSGHPVVF